MHFSRAHASRTRRGWEAETEVPTQSWKMDGGGGASTDEEGEPQAEAPRQAARAAEQGPEPLSEAASQGNPPRPRQQAAHRREVNERPPDVGFRVNPALVAHREREERAVEESRWDLGR
jgi:hypothetical protein